jgi:hypothetical protein
MKANTYSDGLKEVWDDSCLKNLWPLKYVC